MKPDKQRLADGLARILGERHLRTSPERHEETARWIAGSFAEHGWQVREQPVPGPWGTGRNVIARREGARDPRRTWILGAHYDTVQGSPGADDNGLAVSALVEAARLLADVPLYDTVEIVAWDMEELQGLPHGVLLGSRAMAEEARASRRWISGVLDLEMIGCKDSRPGTQRFPTGFRLLFPREVRWVDQREGRGDFIAVVSNDASSELAAAFARAAARVGLPQLTLPVTGLARFIPHFYRSDHAPFWKNDFPAVMITDTADFRSDRYHTARDTAEHVDIDFAALVLEAALGALLELAGGRHDPR